MRAPRHPAAVVALLLATAVAGAAQQPAEPRTGAVETTRAGVETDETVVAPPDLPQEARQFDFWLGTWDVNLRIVLDDGTWPDSSVRASANVYSVLGGKGVLELWDSEPIVGFSLRWFDPESGRWILWLDWPGRDRSGSSGLEGSFRHGRGEFFSRRPTEDGGERLARYTFSDITADSLRWDDAYSTDGGKSWSPAWIMEFTRSGPPPELPAGGGEILTFHDGGRCPDPRFRWFEPLSGTHRGTLRSSSAHGEAAVLPARLDAWRLLDGCAVLARLTVEGGEGPGESIHLLTWNTYAQVFEESVLDDAPASLLEVYYGEPSAEGPAVLVLSGQHRAEPGTKRHRWTLESGEIRLEVETTRDGGRTWEPATAAVFPADGGD